VCWKAADFPHGIDGVLQRGMKWVQYTWYATPRPAATAGRPGHAIVEDDTDSSGRSQPR